MQRRTKLILLAVGAFVLLAQASAVSAHGGSGRGGGDDRLRNSTTFNGTAKPPCPPKPDNATYNATFDGHHGLPHNGTFNGTKPENHTEGGYPGGGRHGRGPRHGGGKPASNATMPPKPAMMAKPPKPPMGSKPPGPPGGDDHGRRGHRN